MHTQATQTSLCAVIIFISFLLIFFLGGVNFLLFLTQSCSSIELIIFNLKSLCNPCFHTLSNFLSQVFNQQFPPQQAQNQATNTNANTNSNNTNKTQGNAIQKSATSTTLNTYPTAMTAPPPFMDPYMFYPYGPYPPPMPYAMPPYGMAPYGPPGGMMYGARHLPDDQQSIQSFHFDMDTRSEKRLNFMSNRPQSVAGGVAFKTEPGDTKNFLNTTNVGLLTADDTYQASEFQQQNQPSHQMNNTQIDTANEQQMIIKREEIIHRMTPQLHQLPHVKGNFSLNSIVQIRANDPCEGQPALVDILNIGDIMEHYLTDRKSVV